MVKAQNSSSEEEEDFCVFCMETFRNSKSKEVWVKCVLCSYWAHQVCPILFVTIVIQIKDLFNLLLPENMLPCSKKKKSSVSVFCLVNLFSNPV
ncbi:unnamed protein product [Gadus morhua 'NCC']